MVGETECGERSMESHGDRTGLPAVDSVPAGEKDRHALRIVALAAVCVVLAAIVFLAVFSRLRKDSSQPAPPDLSRCTRIEVRYQPFILGYPVWNDEAEKSLLDAEEVRHVETLLNAVIDDPEAIGAFARMVRSGSYVGLMSGTFSTKIIADVVVRFADGPPVSFVVFGDHMLVMEDRRMFNCRAPLGTLDRITSQVQSSTLLPQIRSRIECARHLHALYSGMKASGGSLMYPPASTWCDAVADRQLRRGDAEKQVWRQFECPALRAGRCNYAMNPACEPNSPGDMVLLFETTAGWNQHGGPESFTFDNHDPRGGLVLLNDGTVKFIRSAAQLRQLRWE